MMLIQQENKSVVQLGHRTPHGEKDKYLQDIFYCDVHLQILLTVSLQPVVGEAIIIRCSKQITVYQGSRRLKKKIDFYMTLFSKTHLICTGTVIKLHLEKDTCVIKTVLKL